MSGQSSEQNQHHVTRLRDLADKGASIRRLNVGYSLATNRYERYYAWQSSSLSTLKAALGETADHVVRFSSLFEDGGPDTRKINSGVGVLKAAADDIESGVIGTVGLGTIEDASDDTGVSRKVFIVHGHDEKLRLQVSELVTSLGLEPVVLANEPNLGRTVIEKFEGESQVGYAVILATPDDVAFLSSTFDAAESIADLGNPEHRTRQNVIFEWGYFAGTLGRHGVALVYQEPVRLPSDLQGLVYFGYKESFEEVQWKLVREFKAAGLPVKI